jgi:hypothetical protein
MTIPGRSTTQAVGHVLQYISEALSKPKGHAYAIFFDNEQAFDGVNRSRVLEKLHPFLGAESQIFKFIAFIYEKPRSEFMMDSHIPKESSRRMAYCKEILLAR